MHAVVGVRNQDGFAVCTWMFYYRPMYLSTTENSFFNSIKMKIKIKYPIATHD